MKKFASVLIVVIVVAAFMVQPVFALGIGSETTPFDLTGALQFAFQFVMGSAVIAAAATFLTNTAKDAGWVTDTQALTWVSALNFILIVGVFILRLFVPGFDLGVIEKVADGIAKMGPGFILPLMPLLVALSKWFHRNIRGVKWIGSSFTLKAKGKK